MVVITMPGSERLDALLLPAGLLVLTYGAWRVLFAAPIPYRLEKEPSSDKDGQPRLRKVPLPRPESTLWLWGNTLDTDKHHSHRYHDWLKDESERVGWRPWLLSMTGERPVIVLSTPEAFDDVLQKQSDIFEKGPLKRELMRDFLGDGIVSVDGELWRLQRKRTTHLLMAPSVFPFMAEVVEAQTHKFCAVVDALVAQQRSASLKKLLNSLTSDIFGHIGFGVDMRSLESDTSSMTLHPFMEAQEQAGVLLQARMQQPRWMWKLKRFLNIGSEKHGRKQINVMYSIVHDIILKCMARDPSTPRKDFLSVFLAQEQEREQKLDTTVVRDMAVTMFSAGQNTTAETMSWFIVMMNRYPAVAAKIRAEITDKLPALARANHAGVAASDVPVPSLDEVQELMYLEACLRESMRLNGMALNSRQAMKDTMLSDGTFVPRGTTVYLTTYTMQHSKAVWGPDADEFKPERWIDTENNKLRNVPPCQFMPFFAGPRICPGRKFAMMEIKMILAVLVSRYDLNTIENAHELHYDVTFTFPVKGPLEVQPAHAA